MPKTLIEVKGATVIERVGPSVTTHTFSSNEAATEAATKLEATAKKDAKARKALAKKYATPEADSPEPAKEAPVTPPQTSSAAVARLEVSGELNETGDKLVVVMFNPSTEEVKVERQIGDRTGETVLSPGQEVKSRFKIEPGDSAEFHSGGERVLHMMLEP